MNVFSKIAVLMLVVPTFPLDLYSQRTQSASDWPAFLGANRDSKSIEQGILKDWSNGKLKIVWREKLGEGYSLGSVSEGKYFQLDSVDSECRLRCFEAGSGRVLWKFSYNVQYKDMYGFDNGPRTTPVVDGDRVYIFGVAGMLHCLTCDEGKEVWKVDTAKKFGVIQNFFGVGSTPIVHEKYLIVMVGGSPEEEQGKPGNRLDEVKSNGSAVVVFDKMSGEVVHTTGDDHASYSSVRLYKDGETTRGLAWLRANIIGFDIENGKQLWTFPYRARMYESVNAMTPVVNGSKVLVSESYGLGSAYLDVSSNKPQVVWRDSNPRKQSLATHWNTPVLHNGHVFACHGEGRANTEIRSVELETGEVKWKQAGYARCSLTFVDEHFVVLDENGQLLLIKAAPDSFQLVTSYSDAKANKLPLKYPCWAAPVIANGLLYVRGKDELLCLELKD